MTSMPRAKLSAGDTGAAATPLPRRTQVLVIGSGAGGAVTAATLAARGYEVVTIEEGPHADTSRTATNSPEAIARLYRNGGLTPILGRQPIAYVEGRCVGGSTEINSAFWHRLPADSYRRWREDAMVADLTPEIMEPYFERLEQALSVSYLQAANLPLSSALFRQGIERMGWPFTEVPRCQKHNHGGSPFAPGNKESMQRTFIPQALAAGARLVPDCKAVRILHQHGRASGVVVKHGDAGRRTRIDADVVFVCAGAVQTAALLRRSGIRHNVGNNLRLHPMIKAAAVFDAPVGAHAEVLPIYQVREAWPNITLGGSVFTPGFFAMLLADHWATRHQAMRDWDRAALYYAATRGMSRGTIRVLPGSDDGVVVRYRLAEADRYNLSAGLAHLGEILFAAGARAVYPSLRSHPVFKSPHQCRALLHEPAPAGAMSLSTVHAFSSCPMGENPDLCATDSFGRVNGFGNLYVNDASLLPDSPGVNPQGTVMAIALRNLDRFDTARGAHPRLSANGGRRAAPSPTVLVTGAPGWLGTRLVEVLLNGLPDVPGLAAPPPERLVRCLVHPAVDAAELTALSPAVEAVRGDLRDPAAARALCAGAAGAVLFHVAGVVHPALRTRELTEVNVDGTRHLLRAAAAAGVRRCVAVSSNSPFGFNLDPTHRFDEDAPYNPYMAYGRSKQQMEMLVREAHATGAIETVIVRPPWFYGPRQPARQSRFFTLIRQGRFPILGDGTQQRSMAHVDNICQGLLLAAAVATANGEAYWIADERPYSIDEIVRTVRQAIEDELGIACAPPRVRLPALVGRAAGFADGVLQAVGLYNQSLHVLGEMPHTIACSIAKARRDLGYAPAVSLREGMRAAVRWCVDNGVPL